MAKQSTVAGDLVPAGDLETLSWRAALARLGDSPELLAHLSRDFVRQFRDEGALIRSLVEQRGFADAESRLHKLKGVAANLGAETLAQGAADLQRDLRSMPAGEIADSQLRAFSRLLGNSIDAMAHLAERLEAGSLPLPSKRAPSFDQAARRRPTSRPATTPLSRSGRRDAKQSRSGSPSFHRQGLPKPARLLVVDDQPQIRTSLAQIFRDDHEVLSAASGSEALSVCRREQPDLVLLDLMMPEMDGIETCLRLQADPELREIPVIFVTAENRPDQEARALETGAVDFITKPLNPAVVRARVGTHLTLKAQADMLRSLAFVDGLTGIGNRRLFDDRLDLEWRACRRSGTELSLLMLDIDFFKRFNDRLGHQQGDACLHEVASVLSGELYRPRDFLARYGGEEFACLLPETGRSGALAKARSLVKAVEARRIRHPDSDCGDFVTVSIGVAGVRPGPDATAEDLLAAADGQLYLAKDAGRNRASMAGPTALRFREAERGRWQPLAVPA